KHGRHSQDTTHDIWEKQIAMYHGMKSQYLMYRNIKRMAIMLYRGPNMVIVSYCRLCGKLYCLCVCVWVCFCLLLVCVCVCVCAYLCVCVCVCVWDLRGECSARPKRVSFITGPGKEMTAQQQTEALSWAHTQPQIQHTT